MPATEVTPGCARRAVTSWSVRGPSTRTSAPTCASAAARWPAPMVTAVVPQNTTSPTATVSVSSGHGGPDRGARAGGGDDGHQAAARSARPG